MSQGERYAVHCDGCSQTIEVSADAEQRETQLIGHIKDCPGFRKVAGESLKTSEGDAE